MVPWISRFRSLSLNISHHFHQSPFFPPLSVASFSTSTPNISIFDYLVKQHQFSPECASNVSSLSSTIYLKKPHNADSVLNFLKENGFAKDHLETLLQKAPWILSANLERTIKPKIKIFQDLGFQSIDLADIVSASPFVIRSSADRLRSCVLRMKKGLGPNADICMFLKNSGRGRFMARGYLDKELISNVEYLKSCGICSVQITKYINRFPLIFLSSLDKIKGIVRSVDEMGVHRQSNVFLGAVCIMSSFTEENWELKLKLFRELGFSEQNILHIFRAYPNAFAASDKKIKEITQLFLSFEGFSVSDIVRYPALLTYSVEKRLKPRLQVIKALQSKNLLMQRPALASFCHITDADFLNKYVTPYSDKLGDICLTSQGSQSTSSDEKIIDIA